MERRLAAVLIADVAGYGRLSQVDEEGTRTRFQADLHEVFEPKVADHHGRLVKTMGDGLLVEFHSVVDAVRCAVEVQRAKTERDAELETDRRLLYRIGINLGDVIIEGNDIHGDGVNIADRLQGLAEPGGIAISGTAYDQVQTRLAVGFSDLGVRQVKNLSKPIRAYRVLLDPAAAGKTIHIAQKRTFSRYRPALAAAGLLVLACAGAAAWLRPWEPNTEPALAQRMALPLPDKPSIAVLPFANISDDPKQEFFIDGMTDGVITELSQVSGLFVIARNSTFAYKGKVVPLGQVAEQLGVRYVLEGSVQRAGDQLRINAQLINALSGGHEWAGKFDGSLADVFALQDKVARGITDALALRLTPEEQLIMGRKETDVPAAYDAFLRGWEHNRRTTPEDFVKAIAYFDEAIALDPHYGRAYEAAAMVYARTYLWRWSRPSLGISLSEALRRARQYLQQGQAYKTALTHQVTGILLQSEWLHGPALAEYKEAIALEPGNSWSYALMAFTLNSAGRATEAIPYIRAAMRLDPHYPSFFMSILGLIEFNLQHFEAAAAAADNSVTINPQDQGPFLLLAAAHGHLGRRRDAETAIARFNNIQVGRGGAPITISTSLPYDFSRQQDSARFFQGLRLGGVPESLLSEEFSGNKLTADEVRSLLFGHRLHGRAFDSGEEYAATITKEGGGALTGHWEAMGGGGSADVEVLFKGDNLCFVRLKTASQCGAVFRNPGGRKAKENEYIWYHSNVAFTFSQVE